MQIRVMEDRDVPAVACLEEEAFSMPWSEQALLESLHNGYSIFLVADEDGEVAGYMGVYTVLDEADVTNVAVFQKYRRQGIGRQLLASMMELAREQGICVMNLEVRAGNVAAIALYEQMGFVKLGVRKNFYEKPREDAWIMQRSW